MVSQTYTHHKSRYCSTHSLLCLHQPSWDSSVRRATSYGMDGPGSIPGSTASKLTMRLTKPNQWVYRALSLGRKVAKAHHQEMNKGGAVPSLLNISSRHRAGATFQQCRFFCSHAYDLANRQSQLKTITDRLKISWYTSLALNKHKTPYPTFLQLLLAFLLTRRIRTEAISILS
jgi:hypothetical protein